MAALEDFDTLAGNETAWQLKIDLNNRRSRQIVTPQFERVSLVQMVHTQLQELDLLIQPWDEDRMIDIQIAQPDLVRAVRAQFDSPLRMYDQDSCADARLATLHASSCGRDCRGNQGDVANDLFF